jgi:hypothetical protein
MAMLQNGAQFLRDDFTERGTAGPGVAVFQRSSRLQAKTVAAAVGRLASFFFLCVAALYGTHEGVNVGLRRIETAHFGVFNRIVDGRINAELLITGSSRALTHYDPRIIQQATGYKTFNIGLNGSQTDMQLAVLKTYLRHNRRPSLLVHNLDSFAFETTRGGVSFPGLYLPYLSEEPIYATLEQIDQEIWKSRRLPLYGYAVEDMNFTWLVGLGGLVGWNPRENRHLGFEPRHTPWTGDFESFKRRNPDGVRFPIEPEGLVAFEELLRLCRELGIRVLLVYSPVYHEMQALERNREEVFARFQEFSKRHGASLWDFSRSPVAFDRTYFYNSQHLNAKGAARFSTDFAAALVQARWVKSMAARPSVQ